MAEHGGVFPRDAEAVRRLPGIGRYTAGAILSIAFDARQPILEANTSRLFSRLLAYRGDPASAPGQKLLWAVAEAVLPRRGVGLFNQALMELGSTVCVAPGAALRRLSGRIVVPSPRAGDRGPRSRRPKARPPAEARREAAVVVRRTAGSCWSAAPRAGAGPACGISHVSPSTAPDAESLRRELVENVRRQTGVTVAAVRYTATTLKHGVTRFRITLECYLAQYVSGAVSESDSSDVRWVPQAELDRYPLHSTARRLARLVAGDGVTG